MKNMKGHAGRVANKMRGMKNSLMKGKNVGRKIGKGFKRAKGVVSKGLPIISKVAKMGTLLGKIGLIGGGQVWQIHKLVMRKRRGIKEKMQRIGRVKRQAIAIGAILLGKCREWVSA